VSHCEALGNEILLTCRLLADNRLLLVRAGPEETLTPGQTVNLEVDPHGWRLFDDEGLALPLVE
jgi:multiple sugar transport system ATP-binding protein